MSQAGEASRSEEVRGWTIDQFHDRLRKAGVTRAYVVFKDGELQLSHPEILEPVRAFFNNSSDFAQHEAVFIGREEGIPTVFFAFVHDTRRGLSQGGLRLQHYANLAGLLEDGLRLSQGMTRKNALAGLWWGGGKGIVALPSAYARAEDIPEESEERLGIFNAYGRFVASLGGVYYTAEDMGTKTYDMNAILSQNRFVTCISPSFGGSGDPSPYTAQGVFRALKAAWMFLKGTESLEGVRVAVQGAGNVGACLIDLLDDAGAKVSVSDRSEKPLERLRQRRPRVHILSTKDEDRIFELDVDILAPCATGAVIKKETIEKLNVEVTLVCGAANNILATPDDAERLRQRGITFVPDFVCNRMGIMNCADEWHGYLEEDILQAVEKVYADTWDILCKARDEKMSPLAAANKLADDTVSELHPLPRLRHRGRRIIDHLIASGWHNGNGKPTAQSAERVS